MVKIQGENPPWFDCLVVILLVWNIFVDVVQICQLGLHNYMVRQKQKISYVPVSSPEKNRAVDRDILFILNLVF